MVDLEKRFKRFSFIVSVEADEAEIVQGEGSTEQVLADEIRANLESLGTAVGDIDVQVAP